MKNTITVINHVTDFDGITESFPIEVEIKEIMANPVCDAIRLLTFEGSRLQGISLGIISVTGRDSSKTSQYDLAGEILLNAAEYLSNPKYSKSQGSVSHLDQAGWLGDDLDKLLSTPIHY